MALQAATGLEFEEQLAALRQRLTHLVPTERWTDMQGNAHDRAFTVAGAMKADLLADLARAVERALVEHKGLDDFRKNFDAIVARHGWDYVGERNWRTRVIYQTNLLTSYAAGRMAQLKDPKLLKVAPYWRYVHNDSVITPRPHHKHWGDIRLTLRHDHPFWSTHYPPNGWGCRCRVVAERAPKGNDATEPPEGWNAIDPKTDAPVGIDKGWGHAPGATVQDELRQLVKDKASKLPEPLARAFEDDVARHLTPAMAGDPPSAPLIRLSGIDTEYVDGVHDVLTAFALNNKEGWLPYGVKSVRTMYEPNMIAATDHRGYFALGTARIEALGDRSGLELMTAALTKIKQGRPLDFYEEYGLESLWHEILHNSQKYTQPEGASRELLRVVEGLHQALARQTYPTLLAALGTQAAHQDAIRRRGPSYPKSTASYYALLGRLGLLEASGAMLPGTEKALREVMFNTPYNQIRNELVKTLSRMSGSPQADIRWLVDLIELGRWLE